ncbi:MAG: hypothetical protein ACR2QF_12155 [Geminicoccaceae bacterium]
MAKINTRYFNEPTGFDAMRCGHNRTVRNNGRKIECRLHGNLVVEYNNPTKKLRINSCGYRTVTTTAAIGDFLHAIPGITGRSSFAGGRFAVTVNGETKSTDGETITFNID